MIYADLDGLKGINDTFGHTEGSRAITRTAAVLKKTFRDSDVVSRLGGDEFAILAGNATSEGKDILIGRLEENLRTETHQSAHGYPLSLSVGAVWVAHDSRLTVDQLIVAADTAMYDRKPIGKRCQISRLETGCATAGYVRLEVGTAHRCNANQTDARLQTKRRLLI